MSASFAPAALMPEKTPRELGYRMPAEWDRHEATWLAWPHNPEDWPGKFQPIPWVYAEIVRLLSAREQVHILVDHAKAGQRAQRILERAGANLDRVSFHVWPTDRVWTRDSGPIFVRNGEGKVAITNWQFNAWAKYPDWHKDRRVPEIAAKRFRKRLFHACSNGRKFVLEGGGIDVNGRGTLLTTEECYLDQKIQVRNPGLSRGDYEETLKEFLGVTNIFWLGGGVVGDDTHGHVDDICRFVNASTVVLIKEDNPSDINYRPLAENWERIQDLRLEDGSKPDVVPLPMPEPLFFGGYRLPASYANFYISNSAVLVPTFNDPNDRLALGILGDLFQDRTVVGIHAVDLVLGYGTLHCLTQQQPAE
jgi:agmatine deiminase